MNETNREALLTWLDLLRTSNQIKKSVEAKLRAEFGQSLSRFDVLSSLERGNRNGIRSGELSRQMLVTDGNITQLMSKLIRDGLVLKRPDEDDARVVIYSLSDEGSSLFEKMAAAHRVWIQEFFTELDLQDLEQLRALLAQMPANKNIREVA